MLMFISLWNKASQQQRGRYDEEIVIVEEEIAKLCLDIFIFACIRRYIVIVRDVDRHKHYFHGTMYIRIRSRNHESLSSANQFLRVQRPQWSLGKGSQ